MGGGREGGAKEGGSDAGAAAAPRPAEGRQQRRVDLNDTFERVNWKCAVAAVGLDVAQEQARKPWHPAKQASRPSSPRADHHLPQRTARRTRPRRSSRSSTCGLRQDT
eukprot:TRINITY_DN28192_c0_g1_i2.p1 TRINITY_DN28192_c0_g1~~TRINITY_DN28192_c0_g1_i2.p1  ORF type:complete len:108 (+),score=6.12 TRINITY_DN28192_c0_g1_i2:2-325(+)